MARIVMSAVKYIANIDAYIADKVAVLTQKRNSGANNIPEVKTDVLTREFKTV